MPRRKTAVKIKSLGAVDIHFHGAFGIDVMTARSEELDRLARKLRSRGVAAFCPTTLSVPLPELRAAVARIGSWISERHENPDPRAAVPLGIHLEGPYLHPEACGAHPPRSLRAYRLSELEQLWSDSHGTLKVITLAPERLSPPERRNLVRWARSRRITLSAGHSRATEDEARMAFAAGFSNVTHAWNAIGFHQRSPGVLGAALGNPRVFVELILDQIHVAPTVLKWTRELHGPRICFVSDCAPAAATQGGSWHAFGNLRIRLADGACRLPDGSLAGGGLLLPDAFARWIETLVARSPGSAGAARILRQELTGLAEAPLRSLGLAARKRSLPQVEWEIHSNGRVRARPV